MNVTRYETAEAFLQVAQPLLMTAEAENNLLLGVAQGIARNPRAAKDPYLATVGNETGVLACAVHVAPFKLVITRANREPIAALARDVFEAVPQLDGVTGPSRSADDFSLAWSKLSGVEPVLGMRLRIHETRKVVDSDLPFCRQDIFGPRLRPISISWRNGPRSSCRRRALPSRWMRRGSSRTPSDAVVCMSGKTPAPVSMAAWTGKTPSGVRINFVYTPRELRGKGYGTACVKALTKQQLEEGNAFCWLYTDLSSAASPNIFKRIGYWPVSDVSEYYLK